MTAHSPCRVRSRCAYLCRVPFVFSSPSFVSRDKPTEHANGSGLMFEYSVSYWLECRPMDCEG